MRVLSENECVQSMFRQKRVKAEKDGRKDMLAIYSHTTQKSIVLLPS